MSHMRSIVTLLVSFAFMGLFSLLSRGTRRPMFDSSLSHSLLLPQRNCASVGTARAFGGDNKKSPTENRAAANAHEVITRVRL